MRTLPYIAALSCLLFVSGACGGGSPPKLQKKEICNNGIDDDGNHLVDCADPACAGASNCQHKYEICDNGVDDNGNGLIDCDDPDCQGDAYCASATCDPKTCAAAACATDPACQGKVEICDNGVDDNGNGLVDCQDPECVNDVHCQGKETNCSNGVDDDHDGLTDCADPDCANQPCAPSGKACTNGVCACPGGATETNCTDGKDNDCDGMIDCNDPDCAGNAACAGKEICNNGIDDNGDGKIDCADPQCPAGTGCAANGKTCDAAGQCTCATGTVESSCNDGKDNDCDGLVDCADPDCNGKSCGANGYACSNGSCACPGGQATETSCGDGVDNDCDGKVDCADSDCAGQGCGGNGKACSNGQCVCPGGATETSCSDGVDNDCDGLVDCADPDCAGAPNCSSSTKYDNGAPCTQDSDCKGGKCFAEGSATAGQSYPHGYCTESCTTSGAACANGGTCIGGTTKWCYASCTSTASCRAGYGCFNYGTASTPYLVCDARCIQSSDCANGTCNIYSGLCEPEPTALVDGDPCTANSDCKSGWCIYEGTPSGAGYHWPKGYCAGPCVVSNGVCPSADTCADFRSGVAGDDWGVCLFHGSSCTSNSSGRCSRAGYGCWQVTAQSNQSNKNACFPRCTTGSDCTSGSCNLESGYCEANKGKTRTGGACTGGGDCESYVCEVASGTSWTNGYCYSPCILSQGSSQCPVNNGVTGYCYNLFNGADDYGFCAAGCSPCSTTSDCGSYGTCSSNTCTGDCRTGDNYGCWGLDCGFFSCNGYGCMPN